MALVTGIKVDILIARRIKLAELWGELWRLDYQIWRLEHFPFLVNLYTEQKDGPSDTVSLKRELEEKRQIVSEEIGIIQTAVQDIRSEIHSAATKNLPEPKSEAT